MIDLLVFWLPILGGGVFLSFAGNAWYSDHKIQAIWFGFGGVVCFLLLGVIQLHKYIADSQIPIGLSATERPWVSINRVTAATDLTYDDKGWDAGTRWHAIFRYEVQNNGNTPAIQAEIYANAIPFMMGGWPPDRIKDGVPQGAPEPGTDVDAELRKMCDGVAQMRRHLPPLVGVTLPPRGTPVALLFGMNGDPKIFDQAKNSPRYSGNLVLLACITYKFVSSDELHQTGTAFALYKTNSKIDLVMGEAVRADQLRISPQPSITGITN